MPISPRTIHRFVWSLLTLALTVGLLGVAAPSARAETTYCGNEVDDLESGFSDDFTPADAIEQLKDEFYDSRIEALSDLQSQLGLSRETFCAAGHLIVEQGLSYVMTRGIGRAVAGRELTSAERRVFARAVDAATTNSDNTDDLPSEIPAVGPAGVDLTISDAVRGDGTYVYDSPDQPGWGEEGSVGFLSNGSVVSASCYVEGSTYTVQWVGGREEPWSTWFRLDDGYIKAAAVNEAGSADDVAGLDAC